MGLLEEGNLKQEFYKKIGGSYICPNCGRISKSEDLQNPVGCLILIILFITILGILFIPFLSGKKGCPKCGSKNVVHIDSPRGKKLLEEFYPEYTKDNK